MRITDTGSSGHAGRMIDVIESKREIMIKIMNTDKFMPRILQLKVIQRNLINRSWKA